MEKRKNHYQHSELICVHIYSLKNNYLQLFLQLVSIVTLEKIEKSFIGDCANTSFFFFFPFHSPLVFAVAYLYIALCKRKLQELETEFLNKLYTF